MPLIMQRGFRAIRRLGRLPELLLPQLKIRRLIHQFDGPLRLHLGCGKNRLPGFINMDLNSSHATDLTTDIKRLPFASGSTGRIECYHAFEHISFPQVGEYLREWLRVLRPGGELVLELPDFDAGIREYLQGNEERLYSIYGRQRFPGDAHQWGYNPKRLTRILEQYGFERIEFSDPQDYHAALAPCLRVTARKPIREHDKSGV